MHRIKHSTVIAVLITAITVLVSLTAQTAHAQTEIWEPLGGAVIGMPAIITDGQIVHLVVRGTEGGIFHKWYDGSVWHPSISTWDSLRAQSSTDPQIALSENGVLAVLITRENGEPQVNIWIDEIWNGWESLGGSAKETPALAWVNDRLVVAVLGQNDLIYLKWWADEIWLPSQQDWVSFQGNFALPPVLAPLDNDTVFIFTVDDEGVPHTLRYFIPTLQLRSN